MQLLNDGAGFLILLILVFGGIRTVIELVRLIAVLPWRRWCGISDK